MLAESLGESVWSHMLLRAMALKPRKWLLSGLDGQDSGLQSTWQSKVRLFFDSLLIQSWGLREYVC